MLKERITPQVFRELKGKRKISMLTAYDYPTAALLDQAGVDAILVGDSLANVFLGLKSTKDIGMTEMLYHCKAVQRAVKHALIIADMPYNAYQRDAGEKEIAVNNAVDNASRFINEAGSSAVKIEWFPRCLEVTRAVLKAGIPVCGHIGLTPQTAEEEGGFKTRGRDAIKAIDIYQQALTLEKEGCFALVMECVPESVAGVIAGKLSIPVIGIGAGRLCDGQVLVYNDLVGLSGGFKPRFVKCYADLRAESLKAVNAYIKDVLNGDFPAQEHVFKINQEELDKFLKGTTG